MSVPDEYLLPDMRMQERPDAVTVGIGPTSSAMPRRDKLANGRSVPYGALQKVGIINLLPHPVPQLPVKPIGQGAREANLRPSRTKGFRHHATHGFPQRELREAATNLACLR